MVVSDSRLSRLRRLRSLHCVTLRREFLCILSAPSLLALGLLLSLSFLSVVLLFFLGATGFLRGNRIAVFLRERGEGLDTASFHRFGRRWVKVALSVIDVIVGLGERFTVDVMDTVRDKELGNMAGHRERLFEQLLDILLEC